MRHDEHRAVLCSVPVSRHDLHPPSILCNLTRPATLTPNRHPPSLSPFVFGCLWVVCLFVWLVVCGLFVCFWLFVGCLFVFWLFVGCLFVCLVGCLWVVCGLFVCLVGWLFVGCLWVVCLFFGCLWVVCLFVWLVVCGLFVCFSLFSPLFPPSFSSFPSFPLPFSLPFPLFPSFSSLFFFLSLFIWKFRSRLPQVEVACSSREWLPLTRTQQYLRASPPRPQLGARARLGHHQRHQQQQQKQHLPRARRQRVR